MIRKNYFIYIAQFLMALLFIMACTAAPFANEKVKRHVEMVCGGFMVAIICGRDERPKSEDPRQCNQNTLTFTGANGETITAEDPPITSSFSDNKGPVMLEDMTVDAIQCMTTTDGHVYVSAQYSRGHGSFSNEIFYDWFKPNGKRLTSRGKPIEPDFKRPYGKIDRKRQPKRIFIEGEK